MCVAVCGMFPSHRNGLDGCNVEFCPHIQHSQKYNTASRILFCIFTWNNNHFNLCIECSLTQPKQMLKALSKAVEQMFDVLEEIYHLIISSDSNIRTVIHRQWLQHNICAVKHFKGSMLEVLTGSHSANPLSKLDCMNKMSCPLLKRAGNERGFM